jgi:hypothetical protein
LLLLQLPETSLIDVTWNMPPLIPLELLIPLCEPAPVLLPVAEPVLLPVALPAVEPVPVPPAVLPAPPVLPVLEPVDELEPPPIELSNVPRTSTRWLRYLDQLVLLLPLGIS